MTTTTRTRLALAVTGLYAAVGALELMSDYNPEEEAVLVEGVDYALEWLFAAATAATATALVAFRRFMGGRWSRTAAIAAASGHVLLALSAGVTAFRGRESLDALFAVGVIALLLGYLTLAVLDLRHRVQPSRAGLALLVGYGAAIVTDGMGIGGGFVLAASWAGVAHLSSRSTRTPAVPAAARS